MIKVETSNADSFCCLLARNKDDEQVISLEMVIADVVESVELTKVEAKELATLLNDYADKMKD